MDPKTRCLNRELTIEMIVGSFIASVLVVLVVFTVVISGSRIFHGGRTSMDVAFDKVGGLRRSDSVLVRGVPIGKVAKLVLSHEGVAVTLALNQPVVLRDGYKIKVEPTSLLGGMQLVIDEGAGEPLPKGTRFHGLPPDNVMEDVNKLVEDIRASMSEGGMLDNLKNAAGDIAKITARLEKGEGTLGKLLSSDDTVYRDLQSALADLGKISGRLERGEGTLGKLLSADDTVYRDLQAAITDIRTMADRLERGEGTLGKLLSSDDTVYRDLQDTLANLKQISTRVEAGEGTLGKLLSKDDTLYADLAETAANLRTVTGRLEAGEGALGQLMSKDSTISKDIEGLVKDVRDALDDMREAAPISTFSSIFFGIF